MPPGGSAEGSALCRVPCYKAWGEDRAACASPPCGTTPTTFRYTGQRSEASLGLYYYGARWYDPVLARFAQADTIVPPDTKQTALTPLQVGAFEPDFVGQVGGENREIAQYGFSFQRDAQTLSRTKQHFGPFNSQVLNRYSYALNCPLHYVDLTGHFPISSSQLWALYCTLNAILGDFVIKFYWALADQAFGLVPRNLGFPIGFVNSMYPFLPGTLQSQGFDRLRTVIKAALERYLAAEAQYGKENVKIDMTILYKDGMYIVAILVCDPDGCTSFVSDPISKPAMEGFDFFPPLAYGFLDMLTELGVDWGIGWGYLSPVHEGQP